MDFLEDEADMDLELPRSSEITSELFSEAIGKYTTEDGKTVKFDVDSFLMDNNFQYSSLDTLIRSLSELSDETFQTLLDQIITNYDDYLRFFTTYCSNDNETLLELQKVKTDINKFMNALNVLTEKDIAKTKETIVDVVEYLKKLDELSKTLDNHSKLSDLVQIGKQLSKTLHELCGVEDIEELLCTELVKQLHSYTVDCDKLLRDFEDLNSPFINHLHNEYQGLIQEFQVSLKILTDRCLETPQEFPKLSSMLISILSVPVNQVMSN